MDRLWLRGLLREKAAIDVWEKDAVPSAVLRKWFCHDPDKFDKFRDKYREELKDNPAVRHLTDRIHHLRKEKRVTFLFSVKDEVHNQAAVLKNPIKTTGEYDVKNKMLSHKFCHGSSLYPTNLHVNQKQFVLNTFYKIKKRGYLKDIFARKVNKLYCYIEFIDI